MAFVWKLDQDHRQMAFVWEFDQDHQYIAFVWELDQDHQYIAFVWEVDQGHRQIAFVRDLILQLRRESARVVGFHHCISEYESNFAYPLLICAEYAHGVSQHDTAIGDSSLSGV
jgi:hypothetical protein